MGCELLPVYLLRIACHLKTSLSGMIISQV